MQKAQIVAYLLVPTDQHAPKTVHPTMRALHHPSAGFETSFFLQCLGFFPPGPNMSRETKLLQEVSHLVIVIALIQTQPLRRVWSRVGSLYSDLLDSLACHLEIIAISAVHSQTDGHATAVGEEAAFGAALAAVGRILTHLFPPREELWSSRRPLRAMPSQYLAGRRIPQGPVPTRPQRRPLPPTLGTGGGRSCWNRCRSRSARSTDSPCVVQRKWHPWPCDHRPVGGGTPVDGVSVLVRAVGGAPIIRQGYANPGERSLVQYS